MDELSGLSMERDSNEEQDEVDILVPGMGTGMVTEILDDTIRLCSRLESLNLFWSSA
jgi:hypothetical protein